MIKCPSCGKNISEFSDSCPFCGSKHGDNSAEYKVQVKARNSAAATDMYAIGAGVICIVLGILHVLNWALPIMHEIPPTSIFARFKAFELGDIIYVAMFALLGAVIIRRKKDKLLVIVTAIFGIWYCAKQFDWLEPLLHGEFHIDYTLQFVLPLIFCIVLFITVLHYVKAENSALIWKLPCFTAIGIFIINTIWMILCRRVLNIIEIIWLPLLIAGSFAFGKWLKGARK